MLVIGENINASNKAVGEAIAEKNDEFLADLARSQSTAGADYIDVNAGVGQGSWESPEAAMEWLIDVVQGAVDKPLAIDSDAASVVEAALRTYRGNHVMINSVNAEVERLGSIGRLAAARGASVVALTMGAGGIPDNVDERVAACDAIMEYLARLV